VDNDNVVILGASALGEKGKPAETVAAQAARELVEQINSDAPVDQYGGDQLIPFLGLLPGSSMRVSKITEHAKTNMYVVEQFLQVRFVVDENKITAQAL